MGKVIGGGLPVGAFGGRADVMDRLSPDGPVYQAGTLSGNPLALAAGLAQLRQLEELDGYRRLEQLGSYLERGVRKILRETNFVFHRIGSMFCLYFTAEPVENLTGAQRSDLEAFKSFFHFCHDRGIYFAPSQFETGFLCLAHTETDIDRTLEVMASALSKVAKTTIP
jgi:glutamate-1-semialdehyde 2,1-aminomutase